MSDNLPHIPLPRNEWIDLYDLSGIEVGQPLVVENVGVCDIYLAVQATQPSKDHKAYNILKRDDDVRLTNTLGDSGAWAFCNTSKGLISVSEREGFRPALDITSKTGLGSGINIDAIGTQRVSTDYSLFSSYFTFDIPPSKWFIRENGVEVRNDLSTKVVSVDGVMVQSSGATAGDISVSESRRHPRYQPNRGLRISESIGFKGASLDGILKAGLFVFGENGAYFKTKGDGKLYAVVLDDGVETKEEEIIFPFDIDITKGNVYSIQIQWHGVATVRYYVNNPSTGFPQLVHIYNFLNTLDEAAYFINPSLSATFSAENVTQEVSLWCGSIDVTAEGGQRDRMQYGSDSITRIVTAGATNGIIAMRSPHEINGLVNTRDMRLVRVSVQAGGKCKLRLYKTRDPSAIAAGAWVTPVFGSFVEFNTTMTSVDPAKMLEFLTVPLAASQFKELNNPDKEIIDFIIIHGDIIVLAIIEGNNIEIDASIEYGEEI